MKPVTFEQVFDGKPNRKEVKGRDPQPATWDQMIRERDGAESGACVEMWGREDGEEKPWVQVSGDYEPQADEKVEGDDPESHMARRRFD